MHRHTHTHTYILYIMSSPSWNMYWRGVRAHLQANHYGGGHTGSLSGFPLFVNQRGDVRQSENRWQTSDSRPSASARPGVIREQREKETWRAEALGEGASRRQQCNCIDDVFLTVLTTQMGEFNIIRTARNVKRIENKMEGGGKQNANFDNEKNVNEVHLQTWNMKHNNSKKKRKIRSKEMYKKINEIHPKTWI